jgi:preprotein translocase subunit SecE
MTKGAFPAPSEGIRWPSLLEGQRYFLVVFFAAVFFAGAAFFIAPAFS